MEVTGWVAPTLALRLRTVFGVFRWDEYDDFAQEVGISVNVVRMPRWVEGYRIGHVVCINATLDNQRRAWCAWHEFGHVMMHPANAIWWEQFPWGKYLISKEERQAWEFASTFPIWGDC